MDYQNRAGSKFGGGGIAGVNESNLHRRERLRRLALESIDLAKDPYFMKNHLGSYECKLCLTMHANDGSYLAHTQGKKHQTNLARRATLDRQRDERLAAEQSANTLMPAPTTDLKKFVKIGRPGYKIMKVRRPAEGPAVPAQDGLFIQVSLPQIAPGVKPRHRFMSAFEQRKEEADSAYQYLIIAAEPYESMAIKIESREIDRAPGRFYDYWDSPNYYIQFFFKPAADQDRDSGRISQVPGL